jgi:glycogen(starch) synthase
MYMSCEKVQHRRSELISVWMLFPQVLARKPVVAIHQSWLCGNEGTKGRKGRVKHLATGLCHNVSISQCVAHSLAKPSEVIGNRFDSKEFGDLSGLPRDRDILFPGRLVSDKGCDLLPVHPPCVPIVW